MSESPLPKSRRKLLKSIALGGLNRPHLARHFSAIQNGNRRSEYEQQEIYRGIQDRSSQAGC